MTAAALEAKVDEFLAQKRIAVAEHHRAGPGNDVDVVLTAKLRSVQ